MRKDEVIIHCSYTKPGQECNAAIIDRWHKARGWSGIGYHNVILRDGTVESGRPYDKNGAHTKGFNDRIGICLVGGMGEDGKPDCNFTLGQYDALDRLIGQLSLDGVLDYGAMVRGHREYNSGKECPCFDAGQLFA